MKLANFYGQIFEAAFYHSLNFKYIITTLPFMEILFIVGILVVLTVCSKVDMKCVWRCVWCGKLLKLFVNKF